MRLPGGRGSWLRKDKTMRRLQVRQIKTAEEKQWRDEVSDCCYENECGYCDVANKHYIGDDLD